MFDFVSNITHSKEYDVVSWEDYSFRFNQSKSRKKCNDADDKLVYTYDLKEDAINKKINSNVKIKAYQLKYKPKFIK